MMPLAMLFLDSGRLPMETLCDFKVLEFWTRLTDPQGKQTLAKKTYDQLREMPYENWTTGVRRMLYKYDLGEIWTRQTGGRGMLKHLKLNVKYALNY